MRKPVRTYNVENFTPRIARLSRADGEWEAIVNRRHEMKRHETKVHESFVALMMCSGATEPDAEDLVMADAVAVAAAWIATKARQRGEIFEPDNFGRACRKVAEQVARLLDESDRLDATVNAPTSVVSN